MANRLLPTRSSVMAGLFAVLVLGLLNRVQVLKATILNEPGKLI